MSQIRFVKDMPIERKLKGIFLSILPNRAIIWLKRLHYLNSLKKFGNRNEPDLKILRYIVGKGETVIDIGANVGWYTTVLSDLVSSSGHVISIEPVPETFTILSWCVKRLSLPNVELFNYAISDKEGLGKMEVPKYDFGGSNFYQARLVNGKKRDSTSRNFTVKLKSLDSLITSFKKGVSFIKCDVEGHELAVIKGASEIITRFKPAWLIELSSDPDKEGSTAWELLHILYEVGYKSYWFDGYKLREHLIGNKSVNYFFLTPDHLNQLICRCPHLLLP